MSTRTSMMIWLLMGAVALTVGPSVDWTSWLFLLAPIVLVPIGAEVMEAPATLRRMLRLAASVVAVSLLLPAGLGAGLLTLPWLLLGVSVSVAMSLTAIVRPSLGSVCFALAGIDLAIGGGWLMVSRLGAEPMGFEEPIVLLTAVHFHFAGFVTAVIVGVLVCSGMRGSAVSIAAVGVVVSPYLIAVGFVTSVTLKFAAIAAFAICLFVIAISMLVRTRVFPPVARAWLRLSALSIIVGMALACLYGWGEVVEHEFIGIPRMAQIHGTLNAIGFGCCGLRAARIIRVETRPTPGA